MKIKNMIQTIGLIKKVFGSIVIITPDRSEKYKIIIEKLKKEKITGIWRIEKWEE